MKDYTTSTENLLELIRSGNNELPPNFEKDSSFQQVTPPAKFRLSNLFQAYKTPTVGVDIGHEFIRIVKAMRTPDGQWRLQKKTRIKIPEALSKKDQEFSEFLKIELSKFLDSSKKTQLWANISTAKVDVRYIRIPKVSPKQIENVIYWTVRKDTAFDDKVEILDYEIQGEVLDKDIPKLSVMVCITPRLEVEELKKMFIHAGFPLSGITIPPFAVQNLLRTKWLTHEPDSMATLFIGNDFSRIDIFSRGNMVMTRGIKAGTNSMVEALHERLSERVSVSVSEGETDLSMTMEQARELFNGLSPDSTSDGEFDEVYGMTGAEIFAMALPALSRLIQQVERTFEYYENNPGYGKVGKLYISSAMNMYRPLIDHIGDQLGIEREIFNPFEHTKTPPLFIGRSDTTSELVAFTPALGLALSDKGYTPNFIFTSHDKEKSASLMKANQLITCGFVLAYLLCAIIYFYQGNLLTMRKMERSRLEKELAQVHPRFDQSDIMRMAAAIKNHNPTSERYLSIALISELSALTPMDIQLLSLSANLNEPLKTKTIEIQNKASSQANPDNSTNERMLEIEGMIGGERKVMESLLAQYIMKLRTSPLFGEISILKNTVEPFRKGETLHFTLQVKLPNSDC